MKQNLEKKGHKNEELEKKEKINNLEKERKMK